MFFVELVVGLTAIFLAIYYYLTSTYSYWKDKGIPGPKPTAPFGNIGPIVMGEHNLGTYLQMVYNTHKDQPLAGIFKGREPIVVVNDLNIIKDVLIKDFSKFCDRGQEMHEKHEPLSVHLFNLEPKRWRLLRAKLSPIFTSGKLKDMFYLLVECADQMGQYLDRIDNGVVDMRDVPARFATDVIGVCAFGLQANSIQDDESLFRKMGKRIFDLKFKTVMRFTCGFFLPSLYRNFIGYFTRDDILDNFILGITKETMEYRKKNNINRHDFVDLLMALKNQPAKMVDDIELTDELLAAQLFVFFAAGFETSSTTIGNVLFELALNPTIQNKLRQELSEELKRTGGKYDYEGIKNMKYMEMVIKETLRKYPPVPFLTRRSVVPYKFAGTKLTIPANTRVWIPIFGIQRDPKHFPKPDVFDPERFNEQNIKSRHEMTFLSFGDGPRNCIGARFGSMQTKVGLMKILQNHIVGVCEKTDRSYEIDYRGILLVPKNGVFLKLKKVSS
nr:cytochrome P450 4AV17 [Meteorus pulchricornis]